MQQGVRRAGMRVPSSIVCLIFACCHGQEFALAREESGRVAWCPGQLGFDFAMRDVLAKESRRECQKKQGGKS